MSRISDQIPCVTRDNLCVARGTLCVIGQMSCLSHDILRATPVLLTSHDMICLPRYMRTARCQEINKY